MCCAHELRRRPPTDASRAGRNRAARHRPSHASSKLTPTRSTSRFLDRLRRSKTDGSCRLHGHQTIRRDAQGRLEPRLPDAPLGDILGCVKTDAEAVDLTLFSTASGGRFSSPADDSYRAGFLPPPRLPGFPTQPPGLVPPSPRVFLFQTNARQAPRFAWRGAVIPARSSAARLTHPRLTSRTSTTARWLFCAPRLCRASVGLRFIRHEWGWRPCGVWPNLANAWNAQIKCHVRPISDSLRCICLQRRALR